MIKKVSPFQTCSNLLAAEPKKFFSIYRGGVRPAPPPQGPRWGSGPGHPDGMCGEVGMGGVDFVLFVPSG